MFIEPLAMRLRDSHNVWRYSILEGDIYSYNTETFINLSDKKNILAIIMAAFSIKKKVKSIDIVHYHYITLYSILIHFLVFFSSKRKKIATIWGSDFYNVKKTFLRKKFFSNQDLVTFTNPSTEVDFKSIYKYKDTISIRFGLPSLEDIKDLSKSDKRNTEFKNFTIPDNFTIVCVGTNGSKNQNHFKIIEEIKKLDSEVLTKLFLLFPVGYPVNNDIYINSLIENLEESGIKNYLVDTTFYSGKKLAIYRTLPDILIQLQTTDQFSGAMQEMIYAGVNVLTGAWLPYSVLDNKHVNYNKINSFGELSPTIMKMIEAELSEEQKSHNKQVIYSLSSWNQVIEEWQKIYKIL